jgi:ankyrin repeat protein
MHIAAISNHPAVVQALISRSASCRIRNHNGLLPLDLVGKDTFPELGEVLAREEDPSGSLEGLVQVSVMKGGKGYAKVMPI